MAISTSTATGASVINWYCFELYMYTIKVPHPTLTTPHPTPSVPIERKKAHVLNVYISVNECLSDILNISGNKMVTHTTRFDFIMCAECSRLWRRCTCLNMNHFFLMGAGEGLMWHYFICASWLPYMVLPYMVLPYICICVEILSDQREAFVSSLTRGL